MLGPGGGHLGHQLEGRSLGSLGIIFVDPVSAPLCFIYIFNRTKKPQTLHLNIFQSNVPKRPPYPTPAPHPIRFVVILLKVTA